MLNDEHMLVQQLGCLGQNFFIRIVDLQDFFQI